ncbi:hypothetical protein CYMTET_5377 [Cymbomonas tetramitiformis]|uniref:Uncharacterized protein n=1 Tax=Cymbomonas tetramitiformis TaxID=36881 RepID=A0AAE0GZG8_9CHLO|nr:hypothetical protein CYMTET_5377 [Cymbomonas tetramitiformis]
MADSDADAFTGTPVPPEIDARRALTFSSGPEEPFPSTPAAGIPEGLSAPERDAMAFAVDCRELLRTPGKQAEIILQIRERCRHPEQKTADWYFDYDTTKGQVARELELAWFTKSLVTVLIDHNPLFATVFDLADIFAPILPEASQLFFRIYEVLLRGSAQRVLEDSAGISSSDGRRVFLVLCRTIARRRVALVSHSYLFGSTPTISMLAGVDPKPFTTEFIQHYTAAPREIVCGLGAEAIWGAGFAIDLLARRMCPVYYKDLLVKYDETTDEGKRRSGLSGSWCSHWRWTLFTSSNPKLVPF